MPAPKLNIDVITPLKGAKVSFTCVREINRGNLAFAYEAKDNAGKKCFLKYYISPKLTLPWYKKYVSYTEELAERVRNEPSVARFCVLPTHIFEAKVGKCPHAEYFQVFDFIEGGHDLESLLRNAESGKSAISWSQRLSMAKIILASLAALHDVKIVHGDLKPANLQLFYDESIGMRWRPALIDMDRSILADKTAPWDGQDGYVGSPNYMSPEHLSGAVPVLGSDVFTTALILYELLGQGHPYRSNDREIYKAKINQGKPPKIRWKSSLNDAAKTETFSDLLQRALLPSASKRPSMRELQQALLTLQPGSSSDTLPIPSTPIPSTPVSPTPISPAPVPSAPISSSVGSIKLKGNNAESLEFHISTQLGRDSLKRIHSDAVFASSEQFSLKKTATGWSIAPNPDAKNATAVNGNAISAETPLNDGDTIALKGKTKIAMPLTVNIGGEHGS